MSVFECLLLSFWSVLVFFFPAISLSDDLFVIVLPIFLLCSCHISPSALHRNLSRPYAILQSLTVTISTILSLFVHSWFAVTWPVRVTDTAANSYEIQWLTFINPAINVYLLIHFLRTQMQGKQQFPRWKDVIIVAQRDRLLATGHLITKLPWCITYTGRWASPYRRDARGICWCFEFEIHIVSRTQE